MGGTKHAATLIWRERIIQRENDHLFQGKNGDSGKDHNPSRQKYCTEGKGRTIFFF